MALNVLNKNAAFKTGFCGQWTKRVLSRTIFFCPWILNAVLLQCCEWMKTQVFENDYVRVMYTSKCACSNQISYRFYCCVITLTPAFWLPKRDEFSDWPFCYFSLFLAVSLHGGGGPQVGEVTCGWSPHLSSKRDQIKKRDFTDRRVTPPTWAPPTLVWTGL